MIDSGLDKNKVRIANHYSARLSELDMQIVHSVPEGGNWKDVPQDVPCNRINQIRESYARGEGSRSTYYGRLRAAAPSYTINTYFSRPGNGCHIHYKQDRVLSQREAARLQSFPDDFIFSGSKTAINTQIGNAVPPLLAYQTAMKISDAIEGKAVFVDLFSGAGGMGLGFKWAGWTPLLANDIDGRFLETYSKNVHSNIVLGSIADDLIFNEILNNAKKLRKQHRDLQLWILGGPPCQGFSTAGKKRSMDDERNSLFVYYNKLLKALKPDGFVFENVSGLLNMEEGKVFEKVKAEFSTTMPNITGWVLNSENFAIPQRRKRVFLIGSRDKSFKISPPTPLTSPPKDADLFGNLKSWVSVKDAISDLPSLCPGEDGSSFKYSSKPKSEYQKLMRGEISVKKYLGGF